MTDRPLRVPDVLLFFVALVAVPATPAFAQTISPPARPAPAESAPKTTKSGSSPMAGVGIALGVGNGGFEIARILPDSPAARSQKLHPHDRLLAIGNGAGEFFTAKWKTMQQVVSHIRGTPGTIVALKIVPVGKTDREAVVVTLTRGTIKELNLFGDGQFLAVGATAPPLRGVLLGAGPPRDWRPAPGKVTVIEFWATWCGPCLKMLDRLQQLRLQHPEWKDRVEVLAASVDETKEPPAKLSAAKGRAWSELTPIWGGPQLLKEFHVDGLPATYIIDARGRVMAAGRGEDLVRVLERHLGPRDSHETKNQKPDRSLDP